MEDVLGLLLVLALALIGTGTVLRWTLGLLARLAKGAERGTRRLVPAKEREMTCKTTPAEFITVRARTVTGPVIEVRSTSKPDVIYHVDVLNGRCSCPTWKYRRFGNERGCKHLDAMGLRSYQDGEKLIQLPPRPRESGTA
jgi:hypothetical protein